MQRILSILFWSIIAAAFIGPGTVTTAASSGAQYGYALLWALIFSTFATLVLQEASARVTVVSGLTLGEAIRKQYYGSARGWLVLILVIGAIIFGCAAYEAGNILGGVNGAYLGTGLPQSLLTLAIGVFAGVILWFGTSKAAAYFLSAVVAFMGFAFLITALLLKPSIPDLLEGSLVPTIPPEAGLLVLGLIGTTVVPYNLFLGSGMATGQKLSEFRFGLATAVILGGIISMGVVIVGGAVQGKFTFPSLAEVLAGRLGPWAGPLFAFGLAGAGLSSAITAPLAAAITARTLFERDGQNLWGDRSWRYRVIWLSVLLTGVGFGLAEVRPIPAIILAQALNGIVLPFVAIFLLLVVNDRALMGAAVNRTVANSCMSLVVAVTIVLGVSNVLRAGTSVLGFTLQERTVLIVATVVTLLLALPVTLTVRLRRRFTSLSSR